MLADWYDRRPRRAASSASSRSAAASPATSPSAWSPCCTRTCEREDTPLLVLLLPDQRLDHQLRQLLRRGPNEKITWGKLVEGHAEVHHRVRRHHRRAAHLRLRPRLVGGSSRARARYPARAPLSTRIRPSAGVPSLRMCRCPSELVRAHSQGGHPRESRIGEARHSHQEGRRDARRWPTPSENDERRAPPQGGEPERRRDQRRTRRQAGGSEKRAQKRCCRTRFSATRVAENQLQRQRQRQRQ
jgi:hypothetical protein